MDFRIERDYNQYPRELESGDRNFFDETPVLLQENVKPLWQENVRRILTDYSEEKKLNSPRLKSRGIPGA